MRKHEKRTEKGKECVREKEHMRKLEGKDRKTKQRTVIWCPKRR